MLYRTPKEISEAHRRHELEVLSLNAEIRARQDIEHPWFCGVRWNPEELDEIKEALEGASVNPGDEITTKRFKEYKADIHGKLFRVPDDSLSRDQVDNDA